MGRLQWDDSLSVGIEHVDAQHKSLFALFQKLCTAMEQQDADDVLVSKIVQELKEYTRTHFKAEEDLMRSSGYPGLESHAEQHAVLTERVAELEQMVAENQRGLALETALLTREWLATHVKGIDQRYATFLKNRHKKES